MALRTSQFACRTLPGAAFLLLATLVVSGCDFDPDRYPVDLRYPLRSDPLVLATPKDTQPVNVEPQGRLNQMPGWIQELGGEILDPKNLASKKKERDALEAKLKEVFGTPRKPEVNGTVAESGEDISEALGLEKLRAGSRL